MPNATPDAGAGTPVAGDHSNATEIASPVEAESLFAVSDDPGKLGSHRDETESPDEGASNTVETVPTRLKGKSLQQVYSEFSGLEKEYSRQGNELGEVRSMVKDMLRMSLQNVPANQAVDSETDPTDEEFESQPASSTQKLIDKKMKPLQDAVLSAEQRTLMLEFNAKRPGYIQTANSEEFQVWVKSSPYRVRMFKAASDFDLDAAEDLFSMWDENASSRDGQPTEAENRKAAIKRNVTETGGAGNSATGKSGKKLYKATELARLKLTDPERYNEMSDEILSAFSEGRVR